MTLKVNKDMAMYDFIMHDLLNLNSDIVTITDINLFRMSKDFVGVVEEVKLHLKPKKYIPLITINDDNLIPYDSVSPKLIFEENVSNEIVPIMMFTKCKSSSYFYGEYPIYTKFDNIRFRVNIFTEYQIVIPLVANHQIRLKMVNYNNLNISKAVYEYNIIGSTKIKIRIDNNELPIIFIDEVNSNRILLPNNNMISAINYFNLNMDDYVEVDCCMFKLFRHLLEFKYETGIYISFRWSHNSYNSYEMLNINSKFITVFNKSLELYQVTINEMDSFFRVKLIDLPFNEIDDRSYKAIFIK